MVTQDILDPVYDPRAVEPAIYEQWERAGAFVSKPDDRSPENTFCIVIPPPNVTGALHLGHALNNTLQDILVRYHRMMGFNTLWQPGTDHAGIATQAVVERRIRELEGKSRHDLGREELVRRIWEWKDEYEKRILSQLKLMGCSCDWDRNRFTLDDGLARAVRHQFFKLFQDGLIFRGKRLVNWDTELQTAVANDEVYHEAVKGHFWHFKYPVIRDPNRDRKGATAEPEYVIIATTRPETMLGDTAVAVNPDPAGVFDQREAELREQWERLTSRSAKDAAAVQKKIDALIARRESHLPRLIQLRDMALAGRKIKLPLVCREIPLICDEWADPMLGSGCVKITPAHDPNDYEVWQRHPEIGMINVMTSDGKVAEIVERDGSTNPRSDEYAGLAFSKEGRAKVVADMESRGLIEAIEDHEVELGHSDRSKTPIEPFLSDQWFVQTEDRDKPITLGNGATTPGLAQAAIDAVDDGRIQVFPPRYGKSYVDWLGEKRDWCISRQLWWGHRISVWSGGHLGGWGDELDRFLEWKSRCAEEGRLHDGRYRLSDQPHIQDVELRDRPEIQYLAVLDPEDAEITGKLSQYNYHQDPDVLDTWFSSALWPFSTLGWPDETEHLEQYYPTTVLCTSRDIITNWVARMVMFGLYSMDEVPFRHVYIHPKILDGRGETMSKSKGNGVDPVDIIHTHGADALRYAMADMTTETQDIRLPVEYLCPHCGKLVDQALALKAEEQSRKSRGEKLTRKLQPADCHRVTCVHKECGKEFATQWAGAAVKETLPVARESSDKFDTGRNFCNKLWNAARFAFMNLEGATCERIDIAALPPEDRWILARLSQTIRQYHECIADYQFAASVKALREFFWESLCDWYIELTKPRLSPESRSSPEPQASACAASEPPEPQASACAMPTNATDVATPADRAEDSPALTGDPIVKQILAFCIDQTLRLWHPTMPFITERLWAQLGAIAPRRGLPGVADLDTQSLLVTAAFPPVEGYPTLEHADVLHVFEGIQDVVRGVRELRNSCKVSPKQALDVTVAIPDADRAGFEKNTHIVRKMANVRNLAIDAGAKRPKNAGSVTMGSLRIYVHDITDDTVERTRAEKALADVEKHIVGKEKKLANENFVAGAKPEVVAAERARLEELTAQRTALRAHLAELSE